MTEPTSPTPTEPAGGAGTAAAPPAPPPAGAGRRPSAGLLVAVGVVIAVVAGLVGGLIGRQTASSAPRAAAGTSVSAQAMCPAVTVADAVLPSIVTISARQGTSGGTGSGEIIKSDGYILTNNHVISVAANGGQISVLLNTGQSLPATLVGRDARVDLAVIKVSAPESLPTIATGDSATLQVGQAVVALGAPLGLSGSVTSGIVSALGRTITVPGDNGQTAVLAGAIQTDASINPGNSGGALVDCNGKLVGVNSAIATVPNEAGQAGGGSVGIGFAIPVNLASQVADELISTGSVSYPYVGIGVVPIPPAVAERFGVAEGLYVQSVDAGGPAAAAGIAVGDVITQVNGQPVDDADVLVAGLVTKRPGDKIEVTYVRDGKTSTTTVTLASRP